MMHMFENPLSLFVVQAIAIIALARTLGVLAKRIRQPLVIAEVTAGILLGPSLLGLIAPDVLHILFPASSMPSLHLTSQIGLIFFMFLVGLELDPKLLRGHGRSSVIISHTSIFVPFVLGAILALYLYPRLSSEEVPFTSFALFLGAAMSITAFPVLARILTERRLMHTPVGAIAITCAAVDDVTAWCILAFVVSIVRATGLLDAALTTILALTYIGVMLLAVRPLLRRIAERGGSRDTLSQNIVAGAFVLLLLSSLATELIGIHALFGAFLLGAIVPREAGFAHAIAEKLEDFVVVLLLPLFFAYSGLRTEIGLLNSPEAWLQCALIILVACAGKYGGSVLAARFVGMKWPEANAVAILMNTRGLMELIVLNIGLDLGVISPALFTMMVLMALVTTYMTTPILHRVYPEERLRGTSNPLKDKDSYTILLSVANAITGPPMAVLTRAMTKGDAQFRVHALHLQRPIERTSAYLEQDRPPSSDVESSGLIQLVRKSESIGLALEATSYVSSDPGSDICEFAGRVGADMVVMGWHKPLFGNKMLGGTVYQVMSYAPADVAVLVDRNLTRIARILVPFYATPHGRLSLQIARRMQEASGVHVTILHVVPPDREENARGLGAAMAVENTFDGNVDLATPKETFKVVRNADPIAAVLSEMHSGYDLAVVGVGEEWGLEAAAFGVQPEEIIQRSPVSVLIVRAQDIQ